MIPVHKIWRGGGGRIPQALSHSLQNQFPMGISVEPSSPVCFLVSEETGESRLFSIVLWELISKLLETIKL